MNDEPCNPFDHPVAELLQNEEWRKTVLRSHTPGVFCYVNPKAEKLAQHDVNRLISF